LPDASGYDQAIGISRVILYEYPFNERIRTYLRLEHLFLRLGQLIVRTTALDHHYALITIFEIMDVATRADLKSDVLKDLEKQKQILNGYRGNPAISEVMLNQVLARLDHCFSSLSSMTGKTGQALTENDWLMGIRSRAVMPGGTCEFDLPAYYAWKNKPVEVRRADLTLWTSTLQPLAESIQTLLKMLRDSGTPQKFMAAGGLFQHQLPQGRAFQLLRLRIDPLLDLVPEISANRLLVAVRLMRMGVDARLHPSNEDASFELSLCA